MNWAVFVHAILPVILSMRQLVAWRFFSKLSVSSCLPEQNFFQLHATIHRNSTHNYHANHSLSVDIQQQQAYPFVGFTFIIIRKKPTRADINCTLATEILRFYRWFNRDPLASQKLARTFDITPLPNSTYDRTIFRLSNELVCRDADYGNTTVWSVMIKVLAKEVPINYGYYVLVGLVFPVVVLGFLYVLLRSILRYMVLRRKVNHGRYQIRSRDIAFIEASKERYRYMLKMRPYLDNKLHTSFVTGEYGFCVVLLRPLQMAFNSASLSVRQELIHMQEWKTHKNLARFLGVTEVHKDRYIVSELSTQNQ